MFVNQFQLSNTEFKNDKMKHNNTVNPTSQSACKGGGGGGGGGLCAKLVKSAIVPL